MRAASLTTAILVSALMAAPAAAQAPSPAQARSALSLTPPTPQEDAALAAAVASPTRSEAARARDAFRRPLESLTFWGLTPGSTVVEIEPGWWDAILEPYARATGGRYVGVPRPLEGMGVADGTADLVLVARAFHNWRRSGVTDAYLSAFFRALKPGGVLAVEQHRAPEGSNPDVTMTTGYMSESSIIQAAQRAGFVLDARSELNANPADDRDHAFGVWTLPPIRRSSRDERTLTPEERAAYDAVGESDRMTLRFRKPEA